MTDAVGGALNAPALKEFTFTIDVRVSDPIDRWRLQEILDRAADEVRNLVGRVVSEDAIEAVSTRVWGAEK